MWLAIADLSFEVCQKLVYGTLIPFRGSNVPCFGESPGPKSVNRPSTKMGAWWCASADPSPIREGVSPEEVRFHRLNGLLASPVFALSKSVAYFSVWAAVAVWIALLVAGHVPLRAFERSDRS